MSQLPISNVITVSLATLQAGLNAPNTGNLVLFTSEVPGSSFGSGAYAAYAGPAQGTTDFGSTSETAEMSNAVFSQQPNILLPGGQLYIVPFLTSIQTLTFSGVAASGSFTITSPLGTTGSIQWNATISAIQTAIQAVPGQGAWTVTGSIASEILTITCGGTYGAVAALSTTETALETSGSAGITTTTASLQSGETLASAITRANGFLIFFGCMANQIFSQADTLAAAAVVQPLNILLGVVSNVPADLTAVTGTFPKVVAAGYTKTRCLYYGANVVTIGLSAVAASGTMTISYGPFVSASIAWNATAATIQSDLQALFGLGSVLVTGSIASQNLQIQMLATQGPNLITVQSSLLTAGSAAITAAVSYQQTDPLLVLASYMSSAMSVVFSGSNTTITMNLKSLSGVLPDITLTQTIQGTATLAGADTYPSIQGDPAVLSSGANQFWDQAQNRLWFATAIAIAGYNYLAQTFTKIPQTEDGMSGFKSAFRTVCKLGITNQYLAPGTWTNPSTFGDQALLYANIIQKGYYIFSAPISQQSPTNRAARIAPLVQIAVKEAGAIHDSSVLIYINP